VALSRFINRVPLLGNGFVELSSTDTSKLGHGMRLKLTAETSGDDHDWKVACILNLHRMKTC
jgi:predicted HD phosphohydrolase